MNILISYRDKHEYNALRRETDPERCTLTGARRLVKRTPDETFALEIRRKIPYIDPTPNANVFRQDRLQRLLLHPKCGLISDPKWGHTDMAFPFAVYEAKGSAGDYREARRQACAGAQLYLNMLDRLVKTPGPPGESNEYQTESSHDFQVFVFTSYGAHWHLLVGIKHPRLPEQYAGVPGMSKDIAVSQKDSPTSEICLAEKTSTAALQESLERVHPDRTMRLGAVGTRRADSQLGGDDVQKLCNKTSQSMAQVLR